MSSEPRRTPLYDLHRELGARMVPFAGWEMPVQYPAGILAEHLHARAAAALFDVSHMGQIRITGPDAAARVERLVPGNIQGLKAGQARYTLLTTETGGILDDLIVSQAGDHLFVVVNAGGREADLAHMRSALEPDLEVSELADRALLALQGPAAVEVLARLAPDCRGLTFMTTAEMSVAGSALPGLPPGLHRRGRVRDFGAGRARRPACQRAPGGRGGEARRPRCPRLAPARGRLVPLRA